MSDIRFQDAKRPMRCSPTICASTSPRAIIRVMRLGAHRLRRLAGLGHLSRISVGSLFATLLSALLAPLTVSAEPASFGHWSQYLGEQQAIVDTRLAYLSNAAEDPQAQRALQSCSAPLRPADFSIAHRGAPALFPEHTRESYLAAVQQGAGLIECDVTFTSDGALVCRHSQCDLHRTTNILETPLAAKCRVPFSGASADANADVQCCTNDLTLAEFRTLCGKHDSADPTARTTQGYMLGATDLAPNRYPGCGTLMTLADSIRLIEAHDRKHTPELKAADGPMPFTQAEYAQRLIDAYRAQDVPPERVFPQSFNPEDIRYWLRAEPQFARQAVLLDSRDGSVDRMDPADPGPATNTPDFKALYAMGLRYLAPPMWYLMRLENGSIVPSRYAVDARAAGLELIAWTLERSGSIQEDVLKDPRNAYYYQSILGALRNDGDILRTLEVLAEDVEVRAVFSDWPATTTVYANCLGGANDLGTDPARSDTPR